MDERTLIINAIKQKKTLEEVNSYIDTPEPDAIDKMVKKKNLQNSYKRKSCDDWNNADFLRYLDDMLKDFGARRFKGNMRSDSNNLNHIYDRLAEILQERMSNKVMKNYMDWWCSIWAPRITGGELYLNTLSQSHLVKRFSTRYNEEISFKEVLPQAALSEVSDDNIYDLGGIDLLIMQKGIVIGIQVLCRKPGLGPIDVMRDALSRLSKEALINVMNLTIQNSPYSAESEIDFIGLAQSSLSEYGLTGMYEPSGKYFKEQKH